MKSDVKKLLSKFTTKGIKPGDLVITYEIHRVKGPFRDGRNELYVFDALTGERSPGRVMHIGPGQQGVFKLK